MKSIIEKQYVIIGETGIQKAVSTGKDLNRKLDSSLKDLGLTKNDIILISSNKLTDISNIFQQSVNKIYSNNKKMNNLDLKDNYNDIFNSSIKENFYLFSKNNRYEIYKQQFDKFYKSKIEDNSLIPSKFLFGGGIGYGGGGKDEIFLVGNKINPNNSQTQKLISYIKDIYTNFKSVSSNINSNIYFSNTLINENIDNIYKSLIILKNYYKSKIHNIRINQETLQTCLEEVNTRVLSIEKKINNYFIIKMNLNNKKEIELFDLLINENKIKQMREKINNQLNYLKEKIKSKNQKFDEMINNDLDNVTNFGNKLNNIIDEKKLNEIKNKIKSIEVNFNELNKKYNKYKFEEEIKKIQENDTNIINVNNSNFTFSSLSNRNSFNNQNEGKDLFNNFSEKSDLKNLSYESNKIKSDSDEILLEIKNFIEDSIIKKFFRFSSDIFITLDSFESFNKKFKSYMGLLENIDKDNFDLLFSLDESLKFRFYCNEYERRIHFLKDLKKTIIKLKKSIKKENEIRQKFNDELVEKEKINDNKFGIHNNIIAFFDWDDIKGNFDVYGDKYYNNIEIEEEDINREIQLNNNNLKISLMLSEGENNDKKDMEIEYYSQQEMIYLLNNKIIEFKSKISNLEKDIERKNEEFRELKFNFEQINNFLNSLYNNKIEKNSNTPDKNDSNFKKENKIFNPLYDEINDEDSLIIDNINNSPNASNKNDIKNNINQKNNYKNENYDNFFLSLEQTYLIKKSFFSYFTNLLSIKNEEYNKLSSLYNSLQMSIEDQLSQIFSFSSIDKINLISLNVGTTNIFIGNSTNMCPCFLLKDFINNNNNNFLCEYYLDINSLSNNIKDILREENNVIIIGVVKDIKRDKNKQNRDNDNKKEENNNYKKRNRKLVFLQKIKYLISYRKDLYSDDFIFKNHIIYF